MISGHLGLTYGLGDVLAQDGPAANAANTWLGTGFVAAITDTITQIDVVCYAVAGTQANRKSVLYIYSDVNGSPGSILATSTELTNFGVSTLQFAISLAVTAGTRYHFVVVNTASVPGTDYFALGVEADVNRIVSGKSTLWGICRETTTNAGAAWTKVAGAWLSFCISFQGGTFFGCSLFNQTTSAFKVYGTRQEGAVFTSPSGASMRICSVAIPVGFTGTPVSCHVKITVGATVYTSVVVPLANIQNNFVITFLFTAPVVILPSTTFCLCLCDSGAGDASNYWKIFYYDIPNYASHRAIVPYSMFYVSTTDGSSFTVTNTKFPLLGFAICNDANAAFLSPKFPIGAKTNPDQGTFGYADEITATQDLPSLSNIVPPDTLEGVEGTFDIATYENGRNVPLTGGAASISVGDYCKIRNVDYYGNKLTYVSSFDQIDRPALDIRSIKFAPNGDVYFTAFNPAKVYRKRVGETTWTEIYNGACYDIVINAAGDVWITVLSTGVYKSTGGGAFVSVFSAATIFGLAINHSTGDVFCSVNSVGVYKSAGGSGAFTILPGPGQIATWRGLAIRSTTGLLYGVVSPADIKVYIDDVTGWVTVHTVTTGQLRNGCGTTDGGVYFCANNGSVWYLPPAASTFVDIGASARTYYGLGVDPSNIPWASDQSGYIYKESRVYDQADVTATIAAAQAANNSAPSGGGDDLLLTKSVKVAGITYNGTVVLPPAAKVANDQMFGIGGAVAGLYNITNLIVTNVKKLVEFGVGLIGTYDPSSGQTTTDSDTVLVTLAMRRTVLVSKPITRRINQSKAMVRTLQVTKRFR
jgi:hypothetical protein